MASPVRSLSVPRTWFLTVRAVEVAVLVLVASTLQELWLTWRASVQYSSPDGAPASPSFMDRVTGMALYGGFRGPIALVAWSLLLAGCLAVLHRAGPVTNARVVRWEWLVLWGVQALVALGLVALGVLALFGDDPFSSDDPSVVSGYQGPGLVAQVLGNLAWPLASLVLLAPSGLWWLRLPAEFEEPEGDRATGERTRRAGAEPAGAWTVERARDDDAIVLDGVEHIPAVERLEPRPSGRGDGSSASGYEDYFRRS
ncbi:hypothetical protein [Phycicoccus sp. Soil748]|uniref:hypothetical protein n=1 Tax=Phycicoccus sp. Soil748 TaxID=1736397 RepID=UPI000A589FA8|nr:hypothetical protein [Phycicoccus sp. Soil748]